MFKYICKRITQMILVLVIVSIATFTLIKVAPGDVLNAYISPTLTAEEVEQIKEDLGLDKSNVEQYLSWLNNVLHGNWGYSHVNHQSVKNQIEEKLPATIGLMGTALIFSLLVAIPLGLISGVKRNGIIDNIVSFFSYISISIPGFWFGILLIMLFALKLKWLPASGMHSIWI